MNIKNCPVCLSNEILDLFPNYSGRCVTSDMMILDDASIDNKCCRGCGLIYNASGTRGFTESFYEKSYSLMMKNEDSAIQNFTGNKPISQAELSYHILREMVNLPSEGAILEIGAGKGEFLSNFVTHLSKWDVNAFEPTNSVEVLKKRLPKVNVHRCEYKNFPETKPASFDVLVALGVLEHVENPLDMLKWGANLLKLNGVFFIRVPNFANNPNDLFCADHLSKLTVPTLQNLAAAAGFEVISIKESGVPVFLALRKKGNFSLLGNMFLANEQIAIENVNIAKSSIDSAVDARKIALKKGENFAIFGMGAAGLFAPFYAGFDVDEISAYIDENETLWGSKIHGRPVCGLEVIQKMNIKHVMLSISPVYVQKVTEKLKPYGVTVYSDTQGLNSIQ